MGERAGPLVYVASKLSGDIERNVEKTREYSRFVIEHGGIPVNPILNLNGVIDEETGRETAMHIDLQILARADELWSFGPSSAGMAEEQKEARRLGIPVRKFTTNLEEI